MKLILSKLIFLLPFWVLGQTAITAEYINNSESSLAKRQKKIVVYANQEKAKQVHLKPKLDKGFEYGAGLEDDGSISIIEKPNDFNNVWYYKANTKDIVKSVTSPNTAYIVYDTNLDYNWEITNEVDTIGQYQVIKALTNFRGRTFIAWFTPSIPISFGPWKLKGLPGLILKMYDQEQNYTWSVRKLNLNAEFSEDTLKPTISEYAEEMTYQEALELSSQLMNEKSRIRNTKLGGRGNNFKTVRHRDKELEREYEWEKED